MDKKIENLIETAKRAAACLKDLGNHEPANALEICIYKIENVSFVKRLKHLKFVLEDPRSQFIVIDSNSNSYRADLLQAVDYYLTSHRSE